MSRGTTFARLRGGGDRAYDAGMDSRAKIPALAVLGLQFTSACEPDDPIVGTWEATQFGDMALPYDVEYDGLMVHGEIELRIGEDLRGAFRVFQSYEGLGYEAYYEYAQDLVVFPGEAGKYRIEISQEGVDVPPLDSEYADSYGEPTPDPPAEDLVLDCELAADQLRCTVVDDGEEEPVDTRWKRGG